MVWLGDEQQMVAGRLNDHRSGEGLTSRTRRESLYVTLCPFEDIPARKVTIGAGIGLASRLVGTTSEGIMTRFFAGVLSIIAVGVMLIAYGLLNPRVDAFDLRQEMIHPAPGASAFAPVPTPLTAPTAAALALPAVQATQTAPIVHAVTPQRAAAPRVVERARGRDWKRTALVIGGSTATGAGLGAVFGGKKGALIGAAIGGGASTIYESTKK